MKTLDDVLTPARVAEMREHVMDEISPVPAHRPSRGRKFFALASAAAVVVVGSVVVGQSFSHVGMSDDKGTNSADLAADLPAGVAQERDSFDGSQAVATPDALTNAEVTERQVITTGSANVVVSDVMASISAIETFVTGKNGRIDQRSVNQPTTREVDEGHGYPSAQVLVRVQPTDVQSLLDELAHLGRVTTIDIGQSDVTEQTADLDARIESLQISAKRLRDIMANATSATDLLAVESQLSKRQAELESLQAQRQSLAHQVELASLSVNLSEQQSTSIQPDGFRGGMQSGWDALVGFTNTGLVALGAIVPWLIPLGALTLIVVAVKRVRGRATRQPD
jgi:hypothetical protein